MQKNKPQKNWHQKNNPERSALLKGTASELALSKAEWVPQPSLKGKRLQPLRQVFCCAGAFFSSLVHSSLLDTHTQRLHLPVKMASFKPQPFRRPAHITMKLIQLLQDVVPLISLTSL